MQLYWTTHGHGIYCPQCGTNIGVDARLVCPFGVSEIRKVRKKECLLFKHGTNEFD